VTAIALYLPGSGSEHRPGEESGDYRDTTTAQELFCRNARWSYRGACSMDRTKIQEGSTAIRRMIPVPIART